MKNRGHELLPHTADETIHAWGPTVAICFEEACTALIEIFARIDKNSHEEERKFELEGQDETDLLALLLEEMLLVIDESEGVPKGVSVSNYTPHAISGHITLTNKFHPQGPIPKGISWEGLEVKKENDTWRCSAIIDI